MKKKRVDVIVAVRNEEENIPLFINAVKGLNLPDSIEIGIIFIEDSSTDRTLELLRKYSEHDVKVSYYSLKKGYGQTAALAFGLERSKADAMITMDVDGGHPVQVIPVMINYFLEGADIVQGVRRKNEKRDFYRNVGTSIFNIIFFLLAGVNTHKQNVFFRLMSKEVSKKFLSNTRALYFFRTNFSKKECIHEKYVSFEPDCRIFGKSEYNFIRLAKFALKAPFSAMSAKRFFFIIFFTLLLILLCLLKGNTLFPVVLLLLIMLMLSTFYKISSINILDHLEVKEQCVNR